MTERRRSDRRTLNQDYLMTDDQVAQMAGVSVHTVRYWRQLGVLPFVKVGKHPRIWHSVFQKVFQKPLPNPFETDKIKGAGTLGGFHE
jgi:excisionase family DNA binding protein